MMTGACESGGALTLLGPLRFPPAPDALVEAAGYHLCMGRRYRVLNDDFDTRPRVLAMEIKEDWAPDVKRLWQQSKDGIRRSLVAEYGDQGFAQKLQNFLDIGVVPFSVVAFHNRFLRQIRRGFVAGAYYPALVGAGALGERILNHLLLGLRDSFKTSPHYKRVYAKSSFDNWDSAIRVLADWNVLLPDAAAAMASLKVLRNGSIHFDPEVDLGAREPALEAIKVLQKAVELQFGTLGEKPWLIPNTKDAYIRKEFEDDPFVRLVYLPRAVRVSPGHKLEHVDGRFRVASQDPEGDPLTDAEFAALLQ